MTTGSKQLVYDEKSLRMRLIRNPSRANFLTITLGGDDLYEMLFTYYRAPHCQVKAGKVFERPEVRKEIGRYKGVYGDMLRPVFTQVTGLETRFPKIEFEKG